jgi:hypothetical protein
MPGLTVYLRKGCHGLTWSGGKILPLSPRVISRPLPPRLPVRPALMSPKGRDHGLYLPNRAAGASKTVAI